MYIHIFLLILKNKLIPFYVIKFKQKKNEIYYLEKDNTRTTTQEEKQLIIMRTRHVMFNEVLRWPLKFQYCGRRR